MHFSRLQDVYKRQGQKAVELIKKLGSRAKLIHQKDMGKSADPVSYTHLPATAGVPPKKLPVFRKISDRGQL